MPYDLTQTFSLSQIILSARSLLCLSPGDTQNIEYNRGMCELIGRLHTDYGDGAGTGEVATAIAKLLHISISPTTES